MKPIGGNYKQTCGGMEDRFSKPQEQNDSISQSSDETQRDPVS